MTLKRTRDKMVKEGKMTGNIFFGRTGQAAKDSTRWRKSMKKAGYREDYIDYLDFQGGRPEWWKGPKKRPRKKGKWPEYKW